MGESLTLSEKKDSAPKSCEESAIAEHSDFEELHWRHSGCYKIAAVKTATVIPLVHSQPKLGANVNNSSAKTLWLNQAKPAFGAIKLNT